MLWWDVFQLIVSIYQIETLLEGIKFHISGFERFLAVSKLLKTPCFNIFYIKNKIQFSVLKAFLSNCNLIMPTISKMSW